MTIPVHHFKHRHESYLQQLVDSYLIPASILHEAIHYALFPGGKRIRPLLVYLLGDMLQLDLNLIDPIAASIELTHCYSLIHDDLPAMDDDDMRRGKPSCHKAFNEATAILVGDGLQVLAIQVLLEKLPPLLKQEKVIAISLELVKATGLSGMISGQSLDLTELSAPNLNEEKLYDIHQLKTGKLLNACVEMILAALALTPDETASALRTYIHHLGIVFQIQDDYLDRYAAQSHLGKGRSSDEANLKTTYASLYSKNQLEEKINEHFQIIYTALQSMGAKSAALLEFTQQLHARTAISVPS